MFETLFVNEKSKMVAHDDEQLPVEQEEQRPLNEEQNVAQIVKAKEVANDEKQEEEEEEIVPPDGGVRVGATRKTEQ